MGNDTKFKRIGIVAGRGLYPRLTCLGAKENGVEHVGIVGVKGDADPGLTEIADRVDWVYAGQLDKAINSFKRQDIDKVIFAGQIKPSRLFFGLNPDFRILKVLVRLKNRNATSIFGALANEFLKDGITVLPATTFLENSLAGKGVLGKIKPGKRQKEDIEFGRRLAETLNGLNIGQTVVVKKGTALAVEAFEGTDKTIIRGGQLGHGSVTVVKMAKQDPDMRFDIPCIGLRTVESLITARAKTLAVQAGMTLLLDKEAVIESLNKHKISIVGFEV